MIPSCWFRPKQRTPFTAPCLQVMTVVKSLAHSGITVCATIHSPTPYCFGLFDRMMLLLRGEVVYFGPNGAPPEPIANHVNCSCV